MNGRDLNDEWQHQGVSFTNIDVWSDQETTEEEIGKKKGEMAP